MSHPAMSNATKKVDRRFERLVDAIGPLLPFLRLEYFLCEVNFSLDLTLIKLIFHVFGRSHFPSTSKCTAYAELIQNIHNITSSGGSRVGGQSGPPALTNQKAVGF